MYLNFRASINPLRLYNSSLLCHQFLPQFLPPTLALVCDPLIFCPVQPVLPWGLLTPNRQLQVWHIFFSYLLGLHPDFFPLYLSWSIIIFLPQVFILTSHSSHNLPLLEDLQPSLLQVLLCQLLICQALLYSLHLHLQGGCHPCLALGSPLQTSCHPRPCPQA